MANAVETDRVAKIKFEILQPSLGDLSLKEVPSPSLILYYQQLDIAVISFAHRFADPDSQCSGFGQVRLKVGERGPREISCWKCREQLSVPLLLLQEQLGLWPKKS